MDSEFFKYIKEHRPEEYESLKVIHKEFKEELKACVEIPEVGVPAKTEDDITKQVQATAKYLKEVQEDYEEMQAEEAELKKKQAVKRPAKPKATATVRQVPDIDDTPRKTDDYEKK